MKKRMSVILALTMTATTMLNLEPYRQRTG